MQKELGHMGGGRGEAGMCICLTAYQEADGVMGGVADRIRPPPKMTMPSSPVPVKMLPDMT